MQTTVAYLSWRPMQRFNVVVVYAEVMLADWGRGPVLDTVLQPLAPLTPPLIPSWLLFPGPPAKPGTNHSDELIWPRIRRDCFENAKLACPLSPPDPPRQESISLLPPPLPHPEENLSASFPSSLALFHFWPALFTSFSNCHIPRANFAKLFPPGCSTYSPPILYKYAKQIFWWHWHRHRTFCPGYSKYAYSHWTSTCLLFFNKIFISDRSLIFVSSVTKKSFWLPW